MLDWNWPQLRTCNRELKMTSRTLHLLAISIVVLAVGSVGGDAVVGVNNVQSRLRREIFSNYDRLVKPDGQVEMELGLTILSLAYCPVTEVTNNDLSFVTKFIDLAQLLPRQ